MKRLVLLLLIVALPPSIYFSTLGAERDAQLANANAELKDLTIRVEQARAAQRKLSQFHEEFSRLGTELTKLRMILPPSMGIDDIRALSDAKATENGVRLTRFDADAPKRNYEIQQQSVIAEVIGSAEGTSGFLRNIQNASRIIDVSSVTLRKDPAGWRTDFIMTCYALPDAQ